jgi:hypothetical protein
MFLPPVCVDGVDGVDAAKAGSKVKTAPAQPILLDYTLATLQQ